jgi:hypothetical protein
LIVRPEGTERRLQPFGQAGRAIVLAHPVEDFGHCRLLQGFKMLSRILRRDIGDPRFANQIYDRFARAPIGDNVDRV